MELGRTKTCPDTHEPNWGKERFRLALPAEDATGKKERLPLILEVWDEDAPGTRGDFLGQVCPSFVGPSVSYLLVHVSQPATERDVKTSL